MNMHTEKSDARDIALKALEVYRRNRVWPESVLKSYIEKYAASKKDSALAWRIVFGVIQNLYLLDYYISSFSKIPLKKIHPTVLDILRLSAYQIIYLDRVPNSAAVNTGVHFARKYTNSKAAGFVNAILRKIAVNFDNNNLPKVEEKSDSKRLSIIYSHPEWLVSELIKSIGYEETEALLQINNLVTAKVFIQVNTLRASVADVLAAFSIEKIHAQKHQWLDNCIEIYDAHDITELSAFKEGLFYVQDPASNLVIAASGLKSGDMIIDGCSAPGGKAFAAATTMKNIGKIFAFDIKQNKISEIKQGADRLGIEIIKAQASDSAKSDDSLIKTADIVFADVPCSGFGVIQKKPEIRYKTAQSVSELPMIQSKILRNLASYVKPGGVLMYSTCTVFSNENEDIVANFVSENPEFAFEPFSLPHVGEVSSGMVTLWPQLHGTDGFFICKLRRKQ